MESSTETKEQYHSHVLQQRHDFKPVHQIPPKRSIETATEFSEQFVPLQVPPPPHRRVVPYVKNEAKLDSSTETKEQFQSRGLVDRKSFKPELQLPPKRDLSDETEQASQFVPKPVPPRPQPHLQKYIKNPEELKGNSETHEVYKAWPSQGVPHKYKKQEGTIVSAKLEGGSVTKSDFKGQQTAERTHLIKPSPEYKPPSGQIDNSSVYNDEFKAYSDLHQPKKFERQVLKREKEDREFTTVTGTSYLPVNAADIHVPVKHIREYRPSGLKLEGESSLHSDYQTHDLSLIQRTDLKKAALNDRQGSVRITDKDTQFAKSSVYTDTFVQPGVVARVAAIKPPNNSSISGPNVKLEGESVLHYSYQDPAVVSGLGARVFDRPASFKPAYVKATGAEDRDFSTQTHSSFVPSNASCPCAIKNSQRKETGSDGHLYFVESGVAEVKN